MCSLMTFNAPKTRELIDYTPIARLLRNPTQADIKWPILVTCSPPEYREEFQISGGDEGFRIRKWLIPPIRKKEQKEFLDWFQDKSGETPKTGDAFEQSEGLILSMMFELRYGDMREFGRRFKERLEGSGLLEAMTQPLALNRLYIWPPQSWLDEFSPEQKDALNALNQDKDFSILDSETTTDQYIRLTHPHLSDVVYKAMRPDSGGYQRAEDLTRAFERALLIDEILASRILRSIADGSERILEINSEALAKGISGIWNQHTEHTRKFHYKSLAFFWTSWSRWSSRNSRITSYLNVSPLEKATECLLGPHRFWGILWESLWADKPGHPKLIASALSWLEHPDNLEDSSWSHVWETLLHNASLLPEDISPAQLAQSGLDWLQTREDRPEWSHVWRTLIENASLLPEDTSPAQLAQSGLDWLQTREDRLEWAHVWETLVQNADQLPEDFLFAKLLKTGFAWLKTREERSDWTRIWEVLIEKSDHILEFTSIESLIDIGVHWLNGREERDEWSFIFEICLRQGYSEPNFLSLGVNWIKSNPNRPETLGIALQISSHLDLLPPVSRNILQIWIKNWVYKSNYRDSRWSYGWAAYWAFMPTVETVDLALKWIEVCPENIGGAT